MRVLFLALLLPAIVALPAHGSPASASTTLRIDVATRGDTGVWLDVAAIARADAIEIVRHGKLGVRVERDERVIVAADAFLWRGHVVGGSAGGDAILAVRGDTVAGLIYTAAGVLAIEPGPDGKTRIIEVEPASFESCLGGRLPSSADYAGKPESEVPTAAKASAALDPVIDVLVLYTAASRVASGGDLGMLSLIDASVAATNTVFENGGLDVRLRLVAARPVTLVESGDLETDLEALRANESIGRWRDAAGADVVAMVVEHSGACGQAYVQREVGSGFAPWAYQVTARHCAIANLSFAHEIAHILGAEHDPGNAIPSQYASFRWSFGHYQFGHFRTLMAYPTPCTGCPRIPYLSNPLSLVDGLPTGVDGYRDNVRTVAAVAPVVAGFRAETVFADGFESGDWVRWTVALP